MRTGALRKSKRSRVQNTSIEFMFSVKYAQIQNDGGTIERTSPKGKAYKITIPTRPFVGPHAEVDRIVEENLDGSLPGMINDYITDLFNSNG